jgi:Protein of unknown function (DUF1360)
MLRDKQNQERATYLTLTGLFFAIFALFSSRRRRKSDVENLKSRELVMLGLATYRLGHLISFDKVTEPLRMAFTETKMDDFGAGMTVEPRGEGVQRAIGELISCPICSGTWAAAALVYLVNLFPGPGRAFITMLGAIGMGEMLHGLSEQLSWTATLARKRVGKSG